MYSAAQLLADGPCRSVLRRYLWQDNKHCAQGHTHDDDVQIVPTNKEVLRKDSNDVVFRNTDGKWKAVLVEIELMHEAGRPLLVGTTSVETSELLSGMLKKSDIPHEVGVPTARMLLASVLINVAPCLPSTLLWLPLSYVGPVKHLHAQNAAAVCMKQAAAGHVARSRPMHRHRVQLLIAHTRGRSHVGHLVTQHRKLCAAAECKAGER
jgi:hypothetical protein